MIFKELTIQNFLSIRSIKLDLSNRGLVLIKGKNCDNPEFDNNGSGKSSMIEALVYALYGRTLRGLKGDAVVHNIPKKNMKIFLDIEDDDGTKYRIARYRKHSTNKNKSLLYRNGKDITPKSEADFNDYVANLLQADYLTFTSSLLYSQESFKFTSATDAEMKSTFDLMLGLDVFSKCLEITKSRLREVESELSTTEWKIKDREDKISTLQEQIEDSLKEKSEYKKKTEEQIKQQQDVLKVLKKDLEGYNKELSELQKNLTNQASERDTLVKQLETKRKKLKEIDALKSELQSVKSEIADNEQKIKRCNVDIKRSESDILTFKSKVSKLNLKIEDLNQKKLALNDDIGLPCPTCGQPMTEDSIEPAKQEYNEKIEDISEDVRGLEKGISEAQSKITAKQTEITNIQTELNELNDTASEFEQLIKKSKKLIDEVDECEQSVDEAKELYFKVNSSVTTKKNQISQAESRAIQVKDDVECLSKSENPYDSIIKKYQSDLESYKKDITKFKQGIQDKLDEKQCLQFWQQAYSNQGIKSLILDDITPFLNRRVNKYLSKLTSGHIEVKFNTQTTLKSGETREKFSIDITNQDGGDEYISNSGGEKKRIDLAINLALQDLVASRSSKRINIAIWDEVFDALDSTGVEKVIELLQELSTEKSSIFVISHNEHLQSYFDNIITVVKKGGYSTLLNSEFIEEENSEIADE